MFEGCQVPRQCAFVIHRKRLIEVNSELAPCWSDWLVLPVFTTMHVGRGERNSQWWSQGNGVKWDEGSCVWGARGSAIPYDESAGGEDGEQDRWRFQEMEIKVLRRKITLKSSREPLNWAMVCRLRHVHLQLRLLSPLHSRSKRSQTKQSIINLSTEPVRTRLLMSVLHI